MCELGPVQPDDPQSPSASSDLGDGPIPFEAVEDQIELVMAWYSREIRAEEAAEAPDLARLEQLKREQEACYDHLESLVTADTEQVQRLSAVYTARYRQLRDQ